MDDLAHELSREAKVALVERVKAAPESMSVSDIVSEMLKDKLIVQAQIGAAIAGAEYVLSDRWREQEYELVRKRKVSEQAECDVERFEAFLSLLLKRRPDIAALLHLEDEHG